VPSTKPIGPISSSAAGRGWSAANDRDRSPTITQIMQPDPNTATAAATSAVRLPSVARRYKAIASSAKVTIEARNARCPAFQAMLPLWWCPSSPSIQRRTP